MPNSTKWLSTQSFDLKLNAESPSIDGRPRKFDPEHLTRVGGNVTISRLTHGVESGRSVCVVQIDLDDGSTVVFEASLRLFDSMVRAFQARDFIEGRPA